MRAQIRPNRLEVSDRFPMLGFTIRTDQSPARAEVAVATDPSLFGAESRGQRTPSNFHSSRAGGPLSVPRGEAVYLVPPEVLARFVGQPRLYAALAVAPEGSGGTLQVAVLPTAGSPYISLNGLTGRGFRRVRMLPSRQARLRGYGANGGELEWAGDAASPGVEKAATGALPEAAPAPKANGGSSSTGGEGAGAYDDGFGPMPVPATPPSPAASSPTPVAQTFDLSGLVVGAERAAVVAPSVVRLDATQSAAAEVALAALPDPLASLVTGLRAAASQAGASVGVGAAPSGGAGAPAGPGAGVVFAPDASVGVYGAAGFDASLLALSADSAQLTILGGGLESLGRLAVAAPVAGAEDSVGWAFALFDPQGGLLGVTLKPRPDVAFAPFDLYLALRTQLSKQPSLAQAASARNPRHAQRRSSLPVARRSSARASSRGLSDEGPDIDLKLRIFIPSPLVGGPIGVFGGDGRGWSYDQGTSRAEIHARAHLTPGGGIRSISVIERHWGESTEYNEQDTVGVAGKPDWWRDRREGAQPTRRATLETTEDNLKIYVGAGGTRRPVQAVAENASILTLEAIGALPLSIAAPDIDADISILLRVSGGAVEAKVIAEHDSFPAYEVYANGQLLYSYDPVAAGGDPTGLVAPMDVSAQSDWTWLGAPAGAQALGLRARTLSDSSFTLNWDEVQLVAQPTDVSCWAAAAAMVVGWKGRMSLAPETIAQIAARTTATGLDPAQVEQFSREIGLAYEPPQSYTIDGFRQLLESNGPLWVGAAVPGLHAIVVTGLYHDGANTYVRISDPWDRQAGTPGAPGPYLDTHTTGSRYILLWQDFVAEYEAAATDYSRVTLQILHSGGTEGRQPSYASPAAGYAMGASARAMERLRLAPPPAPRARAMTGAEVAAAIAGVVLDRVVNNEGDVSWELDQFRGIKHPGDQAPAGAPGFRDAPTIHLTGWPVAGGLVDDISADFDVDFQFNGRSLGNVRITNSGVNDAVGWGLRVRAQIMDDNVLHPPNDCAALRVHFHYRFTRSIGSDVIAVVELRLFGDGTYERTSRWVQAEALARGAA